MKSEKRFKAVLERGGAKGLGWVIARVPKEPGDLQGELADNTKKDIQGG